MIFLTRPRPGDALTAWSLILQRQGNVSGALSCKHQALLVKSLELNLCFSLMQKVQSDAIRKEKGADVRDAQ